MTDGGSQVMMAWKDPSKMHGGGRQREERWTMRVSGGFAFPRGSAGVSRLEFEKGWSTKRNDGALGGFRNTWGFKRCYWVGYKGFQGRYGKWRNGALWLKLGFEMYCIVAKLGFPVLCTLIPLDYIELLHRLTRSNVTC